MAKSNVSELSPVFYESYYCDSCQTKTFEEFSSFSHDSHCVANIILFSVISRRFVELYNFKFACLLSSAFYSYISIYSRKNNSIPRVLGLSPRHFQLLFQPQKLICGLCTRPYPRQLLLKHFLLCTMTDTPISLDSETIPNLLDKQYLTQCLVQIEFASPSVPTIFPFQIVLHLFAIYLMRTVIFTPDSLLRLRS